MAKGIFMIMNYKAKNKKELLTKRKINKKTVSEKIVDQTTEQTN